jgi:hypothetical protein
VNLGHPFADRDFLRTVILAVVAGYASTGPCWFQDKNLILEARHRNVFMEKRFVVNFKIAWINLGAGPLGPGLRLG